MELIIITAIREFDKEIKQLLKKSGVATFSHMPVKGFKNMADDEMEDNWFASEVGEYESTLYYAFVQNGNVDKVLQSINEFNAKQETASKIHVAVLDIKRTNIF